MPHDDATATQVMVIGAVEVVADEDGREPWRGALALGGRADAGHPADVRGDDVGRSRYAVEIVLPNGTRIALPNDFDASALRRPVTRGPASASAPGPAIPTIVWSG